MCNCTPYAYSKSPFIFKDDEKYGRQIGTANLSKVRALPYVFTEQGIYMLATVINSTTAIEVSKSIMRTFTKLREFRNTAPMGGGLFEIRAKGKEGIRRFFSI